MNINFGEWPIKRRLVREGRKRGGIFEPHAVTDNRKSVAELAEDILSIQREVSFIHIRERDKTAGEIMRLLTLLKKGGADKDKLIINDRADIALLPIYTVFSFRPAAFP